MRVQRDFAERVENMVNATKLTQMQQDELNNKLLSAAINGDIRKVKESIANGVNVDARDEKGKTALHWAAQGENVDVVGVLIENGVNVNVKNKNNETAAEMALRCGYHQIAELIDDSINHRKALDILNMDMNELVRMADESAKKLCRKDREYGKCNKINTDATKRT